MFFRATHELSEREIFGCFGAIFAGHGADVKSVDWHPQKGLLASGSRDPQQPVMLWDPRQPAPISTL